MTDRPTRPTCYSFCRWVLVTKHTEREVRQSPIPLHAVRVFQCEDCGRLLEVPVSRYHERRSRLALTTRGALPDQVTIHDVLSLDAR